MRFRGNIKLRLSRCLAVPVNLTPRCTALISGIKTIISYTPAASPLLESSPATAAPWRLHAGSFTQPPSTKTQIRPHVLKRKHDAVSRASDRSAVNNFQTSSFGLFSSDYHDKLTSAHLPASGFLTSNANLGVFTSSIVHVALWFGALARAMPLRSLFAFTTAKLFISLICQTHLLRKLTVTRNTDGNFSTRFNRERHPIPFKASAVFFPPSSPSCKIKTRVLRRATQRKQLWLAFITVCSHVLLLLLQI